MINKQKPLTVTRWVLFTTYGWFIGILLIVVLAIIGESILKMEEGSGGQAIVGIGMGAGVGLMQWLAVRNYLQSSQKIFWFTLIGFSIAFILMDIIGAITNSKINGVTISAEAVLPYTILLSSLITSWLQYYFIFKKIIDNSIYWILFSIIGWFLATEITIGDFMPNIKFGEHFPKVFVFIIALSSLSVGGPVVGFITGRFIIPKIKKLNERN